MLNSDGDFEGHGDGDATCKQTLKSTDNTLGPAYNESFYQYNLLVVTEFFLKLMSIRSVLFLEQNLLVVEGCSY